MAHGRRRLSDIHDRESHTHVHIRARLFRRLFHAPRVRTCSLPSVAITTRNSDSKTPSTKFGLCSRCGCRSPSPTWFVACVGNNNRLPPPAWWARRRRMRSTGGVGRLTATTDLPLGRHSGQCTVARTTQAHVSAVGLPADQAGMRMWCRRSDQGQRESLISFSSVAASSVTACNW